MRAVYVETGSDFWADVERLVTELDLGDFGEFLAAAADVPGPPADAERRLRERIAPLVLAMGEGPSYP